MNDIIMQQVQSALSVIVLAVIASLASVVTAFIYKSRDHFLEWIKSRTSESQRNTLWKIAQEAFAHAEAAGLPEKGREKLNYALDYAAKRLQESGIKITTTEIKAAIEKACLEHNKAKPVEIKLDKAE